MNCFALEKYNKSKTAVNDCRFCYGEKEHDKPEKQLIILISITSLVIILAVCGNYLLIKAFYKFPRLRTASNVTVMSLCAADSLIPILFALKVSEMATKLSGVDTHCFRICQLTAMFSIVLLAVIILHLALISVERFISVKFSLRYHTIVTKRRALLACIVAWLWAVAVTVIFPQGLRASDKDAAYERLFKALHPCHKTEGGNNLPPSSKSYLIFLITSQLIIPLAVILCLYSYIFLVSHKHRKQIREQNDIQGIAAIKHELKGARTFAIVITVCLASILPELISTSLKFFGKLPDDNGYHPRRNHWKVFRHSSYTIAFSLNAICNPLIYAWRNEQFKSAFRTLLKCGRDTE